MQHSFHVWLNDDGQYLLPPDTYAAIRFKYNDLSRRYVADEIEVGTRGQMLFRHEQNLKYFDKIRIEPTCCIVRVSQHNDPSDYAENDGAVNSANWKRIINWQQTLRALLARCHEEYPVRIAGYDGPITPG